MVNTTGYGHREVVSDCADLSVNFPLRIEYDCPYS